MSKPKPLPKINTGKQKKDPKNKIVKRFHYYDADGKRRNKTLTAYSEAEMAEKIVEWNKYIDENKSRSMTVLEALDAYIDIKAPVLSPSSVRSYRRVVESRIKKHAISSMDINDLTTLDMQKFINWEVSEELSPKTVKDHYCLLKSAVNMQRKIDFDVVLPQQRKHFGYTPSDTEIKTLIEYVKGINDAELLRSILLCAFGPLRRSEAFAITDKDINGNKITIDKALVRDEYGAWVVKTTKNKESTRIITYPEFVIAELKGIKGRVLPSDPNVISNRYRRAMARAGLPVCGMHGLRRYGASIMHALNVPDVYIMQRGGWKTNDVMRRIYINALDDEAMKQTSVIIDHFEKL